jgi:thioredoxin
LQKSFIFVFILIIAGCWLFSEDTVSDTLKSATPKITMLELGSVGCVPCKMMEPVMESVRESYGDQIRVIFYDVKIDKEKAAEWKIRMIPTQVFLDEAGNEIHRHVGFYPKEQIDEFLQAQGLVILNNPEEE